MSRIVYSHRIQGILQQTVVELGLTLTLSDDGSDVSLKENDAMLSNVTDAMGIVLHRAETNGVSIYTFRSK